MRTYTITITTDIDTSEVENVMRDACDWIAESFDQDEPFAITAVGHLGHDVSEINWTAEMVAEANS